VLVETWFSLRLAAFRSAVRLLTVGILPLLLRLHRKQWRSHKGFKSKLSVWHSQTALRKAAKPLKQTVLCKSQLAQVVISSISQRLKRWMSLTLLLMTSEKKRRIA
jgi:hypothetical protein